MPRFSGTNGAFHHRDIGGMPQATYPMEYMRDAWISQRDKYMNMIPTNHNYGGRKASGRGTCVEKSNGGTRKKRQGPKVPKSPKAKKPKRGPRAPKDENAPSVQRARVPKKTTEIVINGIDMDISRIPIPDVSVSFAYEYKRRGARIAGRKMSIGAFKKVLEKLAAEGYNFSNPIDLRTYWAKHGTNKFVTISTSQSGVVVRSGGMDGVRAAKGGGGCGRGAAVGVEGGDPKKLPSLNLSKRK
ncbi:hypothetical protein JHK82_018114 [Glycine max]|nr:hypothetical protein JHK82_018114 [Glycine max]